MHIIVSRINLFVATNKTTFFQECTISCFYITIIDFLYFKVPASVKNTDLTWICLSFLKSSVCIKDFPQQLQKATGHKLKHLKDWKK